MTATTLADAQAQLVAWRAASLAAARNQSYQIGDRSLTRADSGEILRMIQHWESEVARLERSAKGRRTRTMGIP